MKIDLALDSKCLLPDGRLLEVVIGPCEYKRGCRDCVFDGSAPSDCARRPICCCSGWRNDGLFVHFKLVKEAYNED